MKVLEYGKKPTGFVLRQTCKKCKSKVEMDLVHDNLEWEHAMQGKVSRDGYGFFDGNFHWSCPVCKHRNYALVAAEDYKVIPIFENEEENPW